MTATANDAYADGSHTNTVQMKVTDAYGNVVPNQTVTFRVSSETLSATSATTDSDGLASVNITSKHSGSVTLTATTNGKSQTFSVNFTGLSVTTTPSKDNATANGSDQGILVATVKDSHGNIAANVPVTFQVMGANIVSVDAQTDSSGHATLSPPALKQGVR